MNTKARPVLLAMLLIGSLLWLAPPAQAAGDSEDFAAACKALENADFTGVLDAPTQLTEAKVVPASGVVPAHCLAKGFVATHVGIELRLPVVGWNGKFIEVGCGGHCGVFFTVLCSGPLKKGYACIASDMGHTSLTTQAAWAYNNLQAQIDWGYRAAHVAALAGKAITAAYYSHAPSRSYFLGCSTGGREAMVETQRFPWDFDGIVAGAPVINTEGWTMDFIYAIRALAGPDGKPVLSGSDAQMIHDAVVAKCDMDDGVKDGVISNPMACKFDPAVLACKGPGQGSCLSSTQVEAVRKLYAGPPPAIVNRVYTEGAIPGSELNWVSDHLSYWSTSHYTADALRYWGFWPAPGPKWNLTDFDMERDSKRLSMYGSVANANNPDIRKFAALGHKLIAYFGWQDPSPPEITDYYETVEHTMGGRAATQNFFRLFMIPGMDHCTGGAGAFAIDYLTYMENWVEKGQAPDKLIGSHIDGISWGDAFPLTAMPLDGSQPVKFTRPFYPYPAYSRYKGKGDPNDAANFVPVMPKK